MRLGEVETLKGIGAGASLAVALFLLTSYFLIALAAFAALGSFIVGGKRAESHS